MTDAGFTTLTPLLTRSGGVGALGQRILGNRIRLVGLVSRRPAARFDST
jgi:hypothetical protein